MLISKYIQKKDGKRKKKIKTNNIPNMIFKHIFKNR